MGIPNQNSVGDHDTSKEESNFTLLKDFGKFALVAHGSPQDYHDAMKQLDSEEWVEAIAKEYQNLVR